MPFLNRVQHTISAYSGASITLGAVYAANAATMTGAGAVNGAKYSYVISDGNKFEIQKQQVYNSGAGTMVRGTPVLAYDGSTFSTTQLSTLTGSAVFAVDVIAEDLFDFLTAAGGTMAGALNWAPSVDVASATTTDIGAAASNIVRVTGTTSITGLGTIAAGAMRWVRFAGALTLTYNATSLILLGGANRTTAAGDIGCYVSEGSGNWRELFYNRADGSPSVGFATAAQWQAATANKIMEPANVWASGAVITITPKANATVTITNASPGVITDTAHGFVGNEPVHYTTTGGLPTGLTAGTEYYVLTSSITTNTYQVSATRGGTAINTSSAGSGTHTRVARVLLDGSLGSFFKMTATANFTLAKPYNWKAGQSGRFTVTQDGTGSRTMANDNAAAGGWGTAGGTAIALSTAASTKDKIFIDAETATDVILAAALAIA